MGWVSAGDYEVALDDGKVVCRNAAGRRLKSVPPKIADEHGAARSGRCVSYPRAGWNGMARGCVPRAVVERCTVRWLAGAVRRPGRLGVAGAAWQACLRPTTTSSCPSTGAQETRPGRRDLTAIAADRPAAPAVRRGRQPDRPRPRPGPAGGTGRTPVLSDVLRELAGRCGRRAGRRGGTARSSRGAGEAAPVPLGRGPHQPGGRGPGRRSVAPLLGRTLRAGIRTSWAGPPWTRRCGAGRGDPDRPRRHPRRPRGLAGTDPVPPGTRRSSSGHRRSCWSTTCGCRRSSTAGRVRCSATPTASCW
ncbi:hypothetical protein SGLAM104S_05296 [Streptomyces glaucescens]